VRRLEGGAVADEDPVLGALPGADHDRRRRGQAEGAGAGDDEHGDEVEQAVREGRLGAEEQPGDQGHSGDADHGGDEVACDDVGQAGDGRLRPLRLLDEADDLRERGLAAHARSPEGEGSCRVERPADDLVARLIEDGDRLAGEHRLVDGRSALDDDAVHGDLLAGTHAHEVADGDGGDGDVRLHAVAHDSGRARLQADELAHSLAGLALGARLQQTAEEDQRDDERRRVEVHRLAEAAVGEPSREEDARHAVEVGRRRAHGDERVHVGAEAVAQRRPGSGVELAAHPELHRCRQRPEQVAVVQPPGEEGEPVRLHGADEHETGEDEADDDLAFESLVGGVARRLLGVEGLFRSLDAGRGRAGGRAGCVAGPRRGHVIPCGAHGLDETSAVGLSRDVGDGRSFGRQVDDGVDHAGRLLEGAFDATHAARARHADDGQGLLARDDVVARVLHGVDQFARREPAGVEHHGRFLGREVDVGVVDAVELAQGAFVTRHAARARHACDR